MKIRIVIVCIVIMVMAVSISFVCNSKTLIGGWEGPVIDNELNTTSSEVYQLEFLPGNKVLINIIRPTEKYFDIVMKYHVINSDVFLDGRLRTEFQYSVDNRELIISGSHDNFPPDGHYYRKLLIRDWICLSVVFFIMVFLIYLDYKRMRASSRMGSKDIPN